MNMQTKVEAERTGSNLHTQLADAKLEAYRNRCVALRLVSSMRGLCNRVNGTVDTEHFLELADQMERKLA